MRFIYGKSIWTRNFWLVYVWLNVGRRKSLYACSPLRVYRRHTWRNRKIGEERERVSISPRGGCRWQSCLLKQISLFVNERPFEKNEYWIRLLRLQPSQKSRFPNSHHKAAYRDVNITPDLWNNSITCIVFICKTTSLEKIHLYVHLAWMSKVVKVDRSRYVIFASAPCI